MNIKMIIEAMQIEGLNINELLYFINISLGQNFLRNLHCFINI